MSHASTIHNRKWYMHPGGFRFTTRLSSGQRRFRRDARYAKHLAEIREEEERENMINQTGEVAYVVPRDAGYALCVSCAVAKGYASVDSSGVVTLTPDEYSDIQPHNGLIFKGSDDEVDMYCDVCIADYIRDCGQSDVIYADWFESRQTVYVDDLATYHTLANRLYCEEGS